MNSKMPGVLTCNACNKELEDETEQKLHYKSEWHRYNLKRKVAGLPGLNEALFQARQRALAEEKGRTIAAPMSYRCLVCEKEYRSSKALDQHLSSKSHSVKASQVPSMVSLMTSVKPLASRPRRDPIPNRKQDEIEDSEDEWVEVDSIESMNMMVHDDDDDDDEEEEEEEMDVDFVTSCCFICDEKHNTVESCMVHMHKQHGFFIPDIEYLKDVHGFLTYLGLKVTRDFRCLYCNDRCHPFQSLEAVRKHMIAKGHCRVRFGDGDEEEDAELLEFYDYSSSYEGVDGNQLVVADDANQVVELGSGGSELIITRKSEKGISVKTFGSREFLRYYRQKPRPSVSRDLALAVSLASRYRSMGLVTVQSKEEIMRKKVQRAMNRMGVEATRSLKIGMKNNVIRNLPKNVPY